MWGATQTETRWKESLGCQAGCLVTVPRPVKGWSSCSLQGLPSGQPPRPAAALGLRSLPNLLLVRFPRPPLPLGTDRFCFLLAKTPNRDLSLYSCGVVTCPKFLVRSHCVPGSSGKDGAASDVPSEANNPSCGRCVNPDGCQGISPSR